MIVLVISKGAGRGDVLPHVAGPARTLDSEAVLVVGDAHAGGARLDERPRALSEG